MSKVIMFSRYFPSYHPRKGEPTYFVEKIWNSIAYKPEIYLEQFPIPYDELGIDFSKIDQEKHHTIRGGHRFKVGDWFSPRVWSGKPYKSKQIVIAPDIQVKKAWDFELTLDDLFYIGKDLYAYSSSHDALEVLAANDGLSQVDLLNWFNKPSEGQIICWNESIEY